jgi:hypothetical protein
MTIDWDHQRRNKLYPGDAPADWPKGVKAISISGAGLFGIHEDTGEIYFDGKQILTKRPFELGWVERIIAGLAALATFGVFVLKLGRTLWGWAG